MTRTAPEGVVLRRCPACSDPGRVLLSEDLDLDLWVSADGGTILRLDEDEFAAAAWARRALDELERLARRRSGGLLEAI